MALLRIAAALLLGWATSGLVLGVGFFVLRSLWPAYDAAVPDKAYTLVMLFVRLVVFSSMIAATSAVVTAVSGRPRFSWVAGAIILAASIPEHLYPGYVWDDYPVWYHLVYLASILPIAVAAGWGVERWIPASARGASAGGA